MASEIRTADPGTAAEVRVPARAGRLRAPGWIWALPPVAALGLVFLYPLALVVKQSFSPDAGGHSTAPYSQVLHERSFRSALWNTVWIAAGSTAGCLLLGFVLALVIAFVPFPGAQGAQPVHRRLPRLPLLPDHPRAALPLRHGRRRQRPVDGRRPARTRGPVDFLHTPWGVLLAEVTYFTPFVMRPLLAAFSQVDTAQLEAAASLGARAPRIVRQVILPEALPSLAAGGGLVLVMCLNEFGIVLFTGAKGVTTLPMLVYSKAILDGDYPGACVVAVVSVLLSVGALRALPGRRCPAPTGGARRAGA